MNNFPYQKLPDTSVFISYQEPAILIDSLIFTLNNLKCRLNLDASPNRG